MLVREDRLRKTGAQVEEPVWVSHRTGRSSFALKQLDRTPIPSD